MRAQKERCDVMLGLRERWEESAKVLQYVQSLFQVKGNQELVHKLNDFFTHC